MASNQSPTSEKISGMGSITISAEDKTNIKDFDEGNSIQVRAVISDDEKQDYEKGKTVKVRYGDQEATARIVSDPIVIDDRKEKGKETLSLIVEKAQAM